MALPDERLRPASPGPVWTRQGLPRRRFLLGLLLALRSRHARRERREGALGGVRCARTTRTRASNSARGRRARQPRTRAHGEADRGPPFPAPGGAWKARHRRRLAKARGRSRPHGTGRRTTANAVAGAYGGTRPDAAATGALACAGTAVACATAARQSAATLNGALPRWRRRQCRGSSLRQRPCRACAGAKPAGSLLDPGVRPSADDAARRPSDFLRRPSLLRALWSGAARGRCHGRRTHPHAGLRLGRSSTAAATAPGSLRPQGAATHGRLARQYVNFLQQPGRLHALRTTPPGDTAAERVLPPSSPTAGSIPQGGGSLHDSDALRATTRNYAHRHRWGFFSLLRGSS